MKNEVKLQDGLCIEFNEFIQNLSFAKSKSNNNIYLRLEKETSGITEEQFSQMFHQSIAGIVIVSENFKFLKVNHIFCNLVGYNAEELLENSFLEIIHPADKKIIKEYSIRALSGEFDTFQFEIRFIHKNGSEIWCLVNSSLIGDIYNYPVHFIIQIIDISTQKNAINNLIQSEQKFKKFFYTLPDMASILRLNDGRYISLNNGFIKNLEYTENEVLGKSASELNIWQDIENRNQVKRKLENEGFVENIQTTLKTKSGKLIDVLISASTIEIEGIPHIFGNARNISDLKRIEDELIIAKEKAEESNQLKTAFLQNISHEIRTPMNAIMGFSELLVNNYKNKSKLETFSEIIRHSCEDLLDIINEILDISKIESGQLSVNIEDCNLKDLCTDLNLFFSEYQKRIGKQKIIFNIEWQHDLDIICTDKVKLKQILINLISNAFKFTNEGNITVKCRMINNHIIQFCVTDSGIGIPVEKHKMIFERFTQLKPGTKSSFGGTGLGLSIVTGLISILGGEISLESEPGKGSTFTFSIPVKTKSLIPKSSKINYEQADLRFDDKKILIVDDDPFYIIYLKEILFKTGIKIIEAVNGKDAIQKVLEQSFDIIIIGINLPDIDGFEATRQIKKYKPELKIIAQTASISKFDIKIGLDAGCSEYISKPIRQNELISIIYKLLF